MEAWPNSGRSHRYRYLLKILLLTSINTILNPCDGLILQSSPRRCTPLQIPYSRYVVSRGSRQRQCLGQHFFMTIQYENSREKEEVETSRIINEKYLKRLENDSPSLIFLTESVIIGILSGFGVSALKLSLEGIREFAYGSELFNDHIPVFLIPALGGLVVSLISLSVRESGDSLCLPPGLRGQVLEVDDEAREDFYGLARYRNRNPLRYVGKAAAAAFTLGSGNSLGPEGPAVEVGMAASRIVMNINQNATPAPPDNLETAQSKMILHEQFSLKVQHQRLLLSCGAAAGVSAGFNAPISAVFFALEIMQATLQPSYDDTNDNLLSIEQESLSSKGQITPILLSSVVSALVAQAVLGDQVSLKISDFYSLESPLMEIPLYLILGVLSGVIASLFSQTANFSKALFDGKAGPVVVKELFTQMPPFYKPALGGLICGLIGLIYPQVLFFGYETLNSLLSNNNLPTTLLLTLLLAKIVTTSVSAGSGLVGGTFAPMFFLGSVGGASFHNSVVYTFELVKNNPNLGPLVDSLVGPSSPYENIFQLSDVRSFAMVGAASVLAALFRAPLTASLLLFELTRDYNVILPLMASAGIGSFVGDILDNRLSGVEKGKIRRDEDSVSWGDLANKDYYVKVVGDTVTKDTDPNLLK